MANGKILKNKKKKRGDVPIAFSTDTPIETILLLPIRQSHTIDQSHTIGQQSIDPAIPLLALYTQPIPIILQWGPSSIDPKHFSRTPSWFVFMRVPHTSIFSVVTPQHSHHQQTIALLHRRDSLKNHLENLPHPPVIAHFLQQLPISFVSHFSPSPLLTCPPQCPNCSSDKTPRTTPAWGINSSPLLISKSCPFFSYSSLPISCHG